MGIIAWTDIETTGIDPWEHDLLEVAFIVTSDKRLTKHAERSWIIQPLDLDATMARLESVPEVLAMHTANGLVDAIRNGEGVTIDVAQEEIMQWLLERSPLSAGSKIPMGGSGTERFELRWYEAKMPKLSQLLHYWTYDIGTARRIHRLGGVRPPAEVSVAKSGNHRALSDIQQHIDETMWVMRFMAKAKAMGVLQALAREDAIEAAKGRSNDDGLDFDLEGEDS